MHDPKGAAARLRAAILKVLTPEERARAVLLLSLSPDGVWLAYTTRKQGAKLMMVPATGGPSRILVEGLKGYLQDAGLAWSSDGRELAYFTQNKIFKLNLESGKSVEVPTGLADARLMQLAWSPDGKTMAFSALQGGDPELWLMSDFLPLLQPRR